MVETLIKEIAEQLNMGFRAFLHKTNDTLVFVPDEEEHDREVLVAWKEEFKILKKNKDQYYEIYKWDSRKAYSFMADFAAQQTNEIFQKKCYDALECSKPFRAFRILIDNFNDLSDEWYPFKRTWEENYVKNEIINLKLMED